MEPMVLFRELKCCSGPDLKNFVRPVCKRGYFFSDCAFVKGGAREK